MRICLTRVRRNTLSTGTECNLSICADGAFGRALRRNLPGCICGKGIKINIIVRNCDGVLPAPALPCNNLLSISSPIRVIRRNPCCNNIGFDNWDMDNFNISDFDTDTFDNSIINESESFGVENFNFDELSCTSCGNNDLNSGNCDLSSGNISGGCGLSRNSMPEEFAIIVRSFNPALSRFLCKYPQTYVTDCDNTIKLIFIFDRNGSVPPYENISNSSNCCSCGFGGCGCGFGCGCGGLFGLTALALLFCCC
ncbi:hypothetical protein SDC9_46289 [bioreactor metagenome]|uniref:Uncharacterized protein n=1 Tax=bioreactor metagenome TaxID=1076179 RepID=A0A644W8E2_9ZZZZ